MNNRALRVVKKLYIYLYIARNIPPLKKRRKRPYLSLAYTLN
jgi:hypothetical protein